MSENHPNPILHELTWRDVQGASWEVAVLPWGATEAHNYHLPYGTDSEQVAHIAHRAARRAAEDGASVVVLPTIPFGVNTQQLDIPLTVNMSPSTQAAVLRDVAASLAAGGVRKLMVLNGHGGNDFRQMIRELQVETPLFLCLADWYRAVPWDEYVEDAGDHAGELETSVMLHLAPHLVRPLAEAGDGRARRFRIPAMRDGIVWAPRRWTAVTEDTGVGDPARATAEKGAAYVDAVTRKLAEALVDLSRTRLDDMYEP